MSIAAASVPAKRRLDLSWPILIGFSAVLCALIVLPMSWLVFYSFTDKGRFTLDNFLKLATDPTFTSPLDVLRKAAEAKDTIQVIQTALQMAQTDPSVMDNIDGDEALKVVASAGRSPQRIFRRKEEVEGIRDARAKAQQAQQGMAAIAGASKMAKDEVPAAVQARDSGMLDGMQQMMQPQQ